MARSAPCSRNTGSTSTAAAIAPRISFSSSDDCRPEHVVDDLIAPSFTWMADAESQAPEGLAHALDDIPHPVVAAVTAVEFKLRSTGLEVQLVIGNQHVLQWNLVVSSRRGPRLGRYRS